MESTGKTSNVDQHKCQKTNLAKTNVQRKKLLSPGAGLLLLSDAVSTPPSGPSTITDHQNLTHLAPQLTSTTSVRTTRPESHPGGSNNQIPTASKTMTGRINLARGRHICDRVLHPTSARQAVLQLGSLPLHELACE